MTYTLLYTLLLATILLVRRYFSKEPRIAKWPGRRRTPPLARLLHLFF